MVLSAADTELATLAAARARVNAEAPSLRLANLLQLGHHMSVDLYADKIIRHARLVVVRMLGGKGYWPYGIETIAATCSRSQIPFAALPGDDQPDPDLIRHSTLDEEETHRLWQYLVHGGTVNADNFLAYAFTLAGSAAAWSEPAPLLSAGLYWPATSMPDLDTIRSHWTPDAPVAALVFYRALLQAGNLQPIDELIYALECTGLNPLPLYVRSLKDEVSAEVLEETFDRTTPDIILNTTGFAVSRPGAEMSRTAFDSSGAVVLQIVFASNTEQTWRNSANGLSARDIAMNVALPEVDGRLLVRAVAFKSESRFDDLTQTAVVTHRTVPGRISFTADLAASWVHLKRLRPAERRIAVVLANYPNRDGRIGNGVGLDTPAGTIRLLQALKEAGYRVPDVPERGNDLIQRLLSGPTNAAATGRQVSESLDAEAYDEFFGTLPEEVRDAVVTRWGQPDTDPFFVRERGGRFAISAFRCGNIVIGLQPARGYNIDPEKSYHDPALVPPHGYFAFYAWLRNQVDAVIHMGKHGNLEWLPGKSLALSESCFPEAALGPLPHIYPFIVNDPGEGSQAKRRASAVIIDHLTPPLARAEVYGPLAQLERLVDEYFEAAGVDPARLALLGEDILQLSRSAGLDADCGMETADAPDTALAKLDNYLCELKEMQIRSGLHVFGTSPVGQTLHELLVALTRVPRGKGQGTDASLIRALASDLGFNGFDPLDCVLGDSWKGARPELLSDGTVWRTNGDTVERLEKLALDLVSGRHEPGVHLPSAQKVLEGLRNDLAPRVEACGHREIEGVLTALDGHFVQPGPSGAPTRGRPEVLPTGRNFYSVDTRNVPTPAAWSLGWKSAMLLVDRHVQTHGCWPRRMVLSAWGTSNMRTGGDDIAQAMALMGVQPQWERGSGRVSGFEVMPLGVLDRPRIDVTLRLSGFFRDAFPHQIDLFDSAVRAVAELDEPADLNPLAARVKQDTAALMASGESPENAQRRAAYRVFGSKPGAYGAGLQALIDERGWKTDADLARAYIVWGGYAYGSAAEGTAEHQLFEQRLSGIEAVIHNQDNREHDLLDSDDYYQFEGGLTAAVRSLSGQQPAVWHNDHSRPESPRIRTLEDELARVVRARVVNPKWISGVMRHGYKGAFEIAATVDYLFAFAATTRCVKDHHFDLVFDAYVSNDEVLEFMRENNPEALKDLAERLLEARDRGLWKPRSNIAYHRLSELGKVGR